ncbi:MAG: hypothetical protein LBK62_00125, partial [Treponema sp.]|nr:hypothetical protein [Treponema sp.]
MNPIGFDPDSLPVFKVKGEISIDTTNSAELQIRNHTYSIDIFQVDIERVTSENPVFTLDTRISGAPTAGTQESLLLRPITDNPVSKSFVTITGYKVKIGWRTSKTIPAELKTKLEANNKLYTTDKEIEFTLTELPRGKLVLHVYRDSTGDIQIELEKDFKPDAADFHYDDDFSLTVKNTNGFSYNGGQITVVTDNKNPIAVDFSPDVRRFLENISLSLTGNKPYPNGYNILLIQNHTEVDVKDLFFTNDASYDGSTVAAGFSIPLIQSEYGDNQGYAILKYGNWKASAKSITTKSISIPKQGYLHIYETSTGSLAMTASEHEWNTIRQNIADVSPKYEYNDRKYGRIKIRNYSDSAVDKITFINRSDSEINYRIADVGKATGPNPGTVLSDSVVAGNYRVFIQLSDGQHIIGPEGLDIAVKAEKFTNENDNLVDIIQTMITPVIPNITYSVQSNGGPPLDNKADGYTTTELKLTFATNVPSFTITKTFGSSVIGTPRLESGAVPGKVWKVPVTSPHAETLRLAVTGTNIDPAEHPVPIYVQTAAPPPYVPVTDVVVINGADFKKDGQKTLDWKVVPENANTRTGGYWTL